MHIEPGLENMALVLDHRTNDVVDGVFEHGGERDLLKAHLFRVQARACGQQRQVFLEQSVVRVRGCTSSSTSSTWPACTVSPSRTRSLEMIPPSRCWTVLLLPSGLMEPEATAPPSIGAKYDQEPNAAMKRRMSRNPSRAGPPIACRRLRAPSLWSYSIVWG